MNNQIKVDLTTESDSKEPSKLSVGKEINLGILLELGSIGAGHAATSLSDILQQPISIDVPTIHTIQAHLIPTFFNMHEMPTIAVYLQLTTEFGCDILLMFELTEAKKIAAMMTCASSIEELDPAMETSAIHELANILIGSFLTAISDFIGISLLPTTPQSSVDTFDAILDGFLIKQSMFSENAMVFETRFKRQGENANCILMIFPSQELKELIAKKSKPVIEIQ
ncbi:MAG TPA: chemotaxis protein CheC [Candidatus Bathyarchaeia archaeon]|nr:chemotaxis protein CheC [Candidatus Bathyarchaeia archaeon]